MFVKSKGSKTSGRVVFWAMMGSYEHVGHRPVTHWYHCSQLPATCNTGTDPGFLGGARRSRDVFMYRVTSALSSLSCRTPSPAPLADPPTGWHPPQGWSPPPWSGITSAFLLSWRILVWNWFFCCEPWSMALFMTDMLCCEQRWCFDTPNFYRFLFRAFWCTPSSIPWWNRVFNA